jgi:hypothetical protein
LLSRRDIHERANETDGFALAVSHDQRPFEQLEITAISAAKPIFTTPVLACSSESIGDTGRGTCTIFRVNLLLPETDLLRGGRPTIAEQTLEPLRPKERAASYIPIPNCIVRSPGNDLKMLLALRRIAFR